MVLAEFVKFKHGLYKSCGIECFEGVMLEPCLLQPCFHVAGKCDKTPETQHLGAPCRSPLGAPCLAIIRNLIDFSFSLGIVA